MYYAHSKNDRGHRHELAAHLRTVAEQASRFASDFDGGELAYWLGLWHDLGKFNPMFQQYLMECEANPAGKRRGPDHKAAGAQVASQHVGTFALLIQGHHGGLETPTDFQSWFGERERDPALQESLQLARREIPGLDPPARPSLPAHLSDPLSTEFFIRMVFSALVDADHLDTEAHFQASKAAQRGAPAGMDELWARFERHQRTLSGNEEGDVNAVRRDVYEACLAAAERPPGLFRLTVPTGGGKTLSGMAFALRHALRHGLERVIVAVPYISITEQTAEVYRRAFAVDPGADGNAPVVLEHHSGASGDADEEGDFHRERMWARLAADNWDAPIIVTTTVQLFESLFANRTSPSRKLHRLARSVIILDEAQALPSHLLAPALDALRQLCDHYGATVVISTATQPAFDQIPEFAQLPATEIVPDPARHFAALRRVGYEWRTDPKLSWGEVAELMRAEPRALAVVNTKKDALALLDALDDPAALHLSTSLCGAHRRDVIKAVTEKLQAGEPCRLVSTQVIEAGVDLDFPLVLRALAPLDSIIQAAGRCNREGKLGPGGGRVVVFDPSEGRVPQGAYRVGTDSTRTLLGRGAPDPDDPTTSRDYFRGVLQLLSTDAGGIQGLRRRFEYPEISKKFRMIEEDTESVIVMEYGTGEQRRKLRRMIERLRHDPSSVRRVLRVLQPYTVAVRSRLADQYRRQGFIVPILPDLDVGEWHGLYDPVRGLLAEDRGPEGLVI
ncbi:MAG: CRISPR-associated endonuclease Cas3'' [Chloroflexota bacterium]|nr:CRISPR-associated endonuclease Cas3'' [Chloroflexota bacterium]